MKLFGIDLGGSQIKICLWNNDKNSSTGVGAEIVENDQGKRSSVYVSFLSFYVVDLVSVSKIFLLTFVDKEVKMYILNLKIDQ